LRLAHTEVFQLSNRARLNFPFAAQIALNPEDRSLAATALVPLATHTP
jgi:hypothetical protein